MIMIKVVDVKCLQTTAAKAKAKIISKICVTIRIERFGYLSARMPPQIAKSIIGAEPTAAIAPSKNFEPVMS